MGRSMGANVWRAARRGIYLSAALLLYAQVSTAQPAPPSSLTKQADEPITVSWENATEMADGSPIEGVVQTFVFWTPADDCVPTGWAGEVSVSWPETSLVIPAGTLSVGEWCLMAYHTTGTQDSDASDPVAITIVDGEPPSGPVTIATDAYVPIAQTNRFVMAPVGTIALGEPCLDTRISDGQNEYRAVDNQSVTLADPAQDVPFVILAECSP